MKNSQAKLKSFPARSLSIFLYLSCSTIIIIVIGTRTVLRNINFLVLAFLISACARHSFVYEEILNNSSNAFSPLEPKLLLLIKIICCCFIRMFFSRLNNSTTHFFSPPACCYERRTLLWEKRSSTRNEI